MGLRYFDTVFRTQGRRVGLVRTCRGTCRKGRATTSDLLRTSQQHRPLPKAQKLQSIFSPKPKKMIRPGSLQRTRIDMHLGKGATDENKRNHSHRHRKRHQKIPKQDHKIDAPCADCHALLLVVVQNASFAGPVSLVMLTEFPHGTLTRVLCLQRSPPQASLNRNLENYACQCMPRVPWTPCTLTPFIRVPSIMPTAHCFTMPSNIPTITPLQKSKNTKAMKKQQSSPTLKNFQAFWGSLSWICLRSLEKELKIMPKRIFTN